MVAEVGFSFQKASGGLDAGVTIYSKRVELTWQAAMSSLYGVKGSRGEGDKGSKSEKFKHSYGCLPVYSCRANPLECKFEADFLFDLWLSYAVLCSALFFSVLCSALCSALCCDVLCYLFRSCCH